ncbi:MAG: metallopeptidase family protein [Gemmatimonadota bacterium]|nr:metallopeptidase family protein [Gemmatimonadota bacterium]
MDFRTFERKAREAYDDIPEEYKHGVDGLLVSRDAPAHPTLRDVYTLGECLTEDHPSDFGGPETTRSVIALYWGSFRALSSRYEEFDWEEELWETLTHELRHHLESLAREDALEGVDYAADETFKRDQDLRFDPWYYQHGDDLGGGVYAVEGALYIEQAWTPAAFDRAQRIEFDWAGRRYAIPRPERLGDVHFVWLEGLDGAEGSVELVLLRRQGWWEQLRGLVGRKRPDVFESRARAEPLEREG